MKKLDTTLTIVLLAIVGLVVYFVFWKKPAPVAIPQTRAPSSPPMSPGTTNPSDAAAGFAFGASALSSLTGLAASLGQSGVFSSSPAATVNDPCSGLSGYELQRCLGL